MCVASGSALSIATFGLFPLAGLDVSPVANKPAAQSQVAILKVFRPVQIALCATAVGTIVMPHITSHRVASTIDAKVHNATSFARAHDSSQMAIIRSP